MSIYRDTSNTDRIGIHSIARSFEALGWSFRERSESDFGIDADVEQKINGERTNRHIALQIKSGPSYIKVKKNGKINFSIDNWHYKYWLQSDRPVLILLYDPDSDKIYWEQVKLSLIYNGPKYKQIEINPKKVISEESIEELNDIIETYIKHNLYTIEKDKVNYEYSISCIEEYSKSIKELVNILEQFRNNLNKQFDYPNPHKLHLQLDLLGFDVKKHVEMDYELLHKALWYLAYLAFLINKKDSLPLVETLNSYIELLISQKNSWENIIMNFNKLFHENIPKIIQRSNKKVIKYLEDYTSLINLSIEEFMACKFIIEQRNYEKIEDVINKCYEK